MCAFSKFKLCTATTSKAADAVRDIEKEKVIRAQRQKVVDAHETAWEKFTSKASAAAEGGSLLTGEDVPVPYGWGGGARV